MRDHHHFTSLNYLLDKYQHNLYSDHRQHHEHCLHSPFHRQHHHESFHHNNNIQLDNHDSYNSSAYGADRHSTFGGFNFLQNKPKVTSSEEHSNKGNNSSSTRSIPIQQVDKKDSVETKQTKRKEELLKDYLKRNQLRLVEANSNGNCLFNSISLALFKSEEKNFQLRKLCVDWIEENLDATVKDGIKIRDLIFLKSNQEEISDYLHDMRQEKEWADYCCLNALSNLLDCQLEVVYVNYQDGEWFVQSEIQVEPINYPSNSSASTVKIRLMYIEELKHYNLLIKCK